MQACSEKHSQTVCYSSNTSYTHLENCFLDTRQPRYSFHWPERAELYTKQLLSSPSLQSIYQGHTMSDADASIKSIFSGHTAGDKEPVDVFVTPRSPSQNHTPLEHEKPSSVSSHLEAMRSQYSPNPISRPSSSMLGSKMVPDSISISSRTSPRPAVDGRLHPDAHDFYDGKNNSTNISLISASSDYQHGIVSDYSESDVQEGALNEPHSRPLSRNSVTSCLSTTATKDGIEGKRVSKPQIKLFDTKYHSIQGLVSSPNQASFGMPASDSTSKLRSGLDSMALPPISLNEKMQMMNETAANGNGQVNE